MARNTLMQWLYAALSIPAKAEKLYSQWRCSWYMLFLIYFWFVDIVPAAYWDLKSSVCQSVYGDKKPFSDHIHNDPYLKAFPCGTEPFEPKSGIPFMVLNGMRTLTKEPIQSLEWYAVNQWWVAPYLNSLDPVFHGGGVMLFLPVGVLLHVLCPQWMVLGGNTLFVMSFRVYTQVTDMWFELTEGWDRAHAYETDMAIRWEFQQIMIKTVVGAVPFRLQVPLTIFNAVGTIIQHMIVHRFNPPSTVWLLRFVAATTGGGVCGVFITHTEEFVVRSLSSSRAAVTDPTPVGPMLALRNAWSAVGSWARAAMATADSVEYLVTAALLAVLWVVLIAREDLVLIM